MAGTNSPISGALHGLHQGPFSPPPRLTLKRQPISVRTMASSVRSVSARSSRAHRCLPKGSSNQPEHFSDEAFREEQISINKAMMKATRRQELVSTISDAGTRLGYGKLGCVNLVTALNRLAKVRPAGREGGNKAETKQSRKTIISVVDETTRRLEKEGAWFEERQLSSLAWALSKMGRLEADIRVVLAEEVLHRGWHGFSAQGLANTAWGYSNAIGSKTEEIVLSVAAEVTRRDLQGFVPQDLGNIAWAIGRVAGGSRAHNALDSVATTATTSNASQPRPCLVAALTGIGEALLKDGVMSRARPQEIANIIWAFGRCASIGGQLPEFPSSLENDHPAGTSPAACNEITSVTLLEKISISAVDGGLVGAMKTREIASMVWGLAKSGARATAVRKSVLAVLDDRSFARFRCQEFAMLLWASACLGWEDVVSLGEQALGAGVLRWQEMKGEELAMVAWAMGKRAADVGEANAQAEGIEAWIALEDEILRRGWERLDRQALHMVLGAFGNRGFKSGLLLQSVDVYALRCADKTSLNDLVGVLGGVVGMGATPQGFGNVTLDVVCRRVGGDEAAVEGLSERALSTAMFALVRAGCMHGRALSALAAEIRARSGSAFTPRQQSNIAWSCATARCGSAPAEGGAPDGLGLSAEDQELLQSLQQSVEADARKEARRVLGPMAGGQGRGGRGWRIRDLAGVAYANALVGGGAVASEDGDDALRDDGTEGESVSTLVGLLVEAILRLVDSGESDEQALRQAQQAVLLSGTTLPREHAAMLAMALDKCTRAEVDAHQRGATMSSGFHGQVSKALRSLGVEFEEERPACKGVYTIDIVVRPEAGAGAADKNKGKQPSQAAKGLAIECDGPTHFGGPHGREPDQRTRRKRALLAAEGWELLAVPHWEWPKRAQAQRDYMRGRLQAAGSWPLRQVDAERA